MQKTKSLEIIRKEIDEIDSSILQLLAQRSGLVRDAFSHKTDLSTVRAPERVKTMLFTRRTEAMRLGLDPYFSDELFRLITGYFIDKEETAWNIREKILTPQSIEIRYGTLTDLENLLELQKNAFLQETVVNNDPDIPAVHETLPDLEKAFRENRMIHGFFQGRMAGSVRAKMEGEVCQIGRLVVHPLFQKLGIGRRLLGLIEKEFPSAKNYSLFTGKKSSRNVRFYENAGYRIMPQDHPVLVFMQKINRVNQ